MAAMQFPFYLVAALLVLPLLTSCASTPAPKAEAADAQSVQTSPWSLSSTPDKERVPWQHFKLPGKQPSQFDYVLEDGRHAIAAKAQ